MSKHLIITFKYKMKGNISKQISVKVTLFLSVESAICSLPVEDQRLFFFFFASHFPSQLHVASPSATRKLETDTFGPSFRMEFVAKLDRL